MQLPQAFEHPEEPYDEKAEIQSLFSSPIDWMEEDSRLSLSVKYAYMLPTHTYYRVLHGDVATLCSGP